MKSLINRTTYTLQVLSKLIMKISHKCELSKEELVESVIATESSETNDHIRDERNDNVNPRQEIGKIKYNLNIVIKYVEDKNDENIPAVL